VDSSPTRNPGRESPDIPGGQNSAASARKARTIAVPQTPSGRNPYCQPVRTLLITGPVGVGKSTTAEAVGHLLRATGHRHAVIDLDAIRQCWPPPPDDPFHSALGLRNLRDLATNYRAAGAERLVLAGVIETREERRRHAEAVGAELVVCRLTAAQDVVRERLERRHRDDHDDREGVRWHLARTLELTRILDEADLADATVDSAAAVHEVAAAVLAAVGWG
jgi:adenylylsulfate kinase